jgi:hypothetical protein
MDGPMDGRTDRRSVGQKNRLTNGRRHLVRVLLLVAVRAAEGAECHLAAHCLEAPAVSHQQACAAEAPAGREALLAL